jgi:hypothetical protein
MSTAGSTVVPVPSDNQTVNPLSDASIPTAISQSTNSGTASYDSDSSTIPAPMETLSNPTSPVNSVGGTENVETEPTFVNTRTETEDGAQGGGTGIISSVLPTDMSRTFFNNSNLHVVPENGGQEITDLLPRNFFDDLDLDAAETWFRTQMEVQPSETQNRSQGGGEEQRYIEE